MIMFCFGQKSEEQISETILIGVPTPLKNTKSVGMMTFPIYGKIQKCSKPPTKYYIVD